MGRTGSNGNMAEYAEPTATFHTPAVLSASHETWWQRVKRFVLRGGRVQPSRRKALSRRRQRAETLAAASTRQAEWLPSRRASKTAPGDMSAAPSVGHRLRTTVSRTSLNGVNPTVREELENRWPKVAGVKPIGSLAESRNMPYSASDTFLAMAMGSGNAPSVSDWDSVDGAASEMSPHEGRPYPWIDAPVEGFDSFVLY